METRVQYSAVSTGSQDVRDVTIRCRELLHHLSLKDDDEMVAKELMASFNVWAANMGVFRQGRQSLASILRSAPQIKEIVYQLLRVLKNDLERKIQHINGVGGEERDAALSSDSEDSSDRSSTASYRLLQPSDGEDDDDDADDDVGDNEHEGEEGGKEVEGVSSRASGVSIWKSIQNVVTSLRQLAITVHMAGAQHRHHRIQRFMNMDRNKQVYELFEKYGRQRIDHLFPNATETLRARMAESIATRRMRFQYLEQHQKKVSTLNQPAPALQHETPIAVEVKPTAVTELHHEGVQTTQRQDLTRAAPQPSVILSDTVVTKLDPKMLQPAPDEPKRAASVASVRVAAGTLPSAPKLDPGGTSLTCPYCFMVYPISELAEDSNWWMSHLIRDFEPFFCVIDDCPSPFACADTYTGWRAHMRDSHTKSTWYCWHCESISSSMALFTSPEELEDHLKENHQAEVTDSMRPALIKHSKIRDQQPLQACPFCDGFPEEIEQLYPDRGHRDAQEALYKHIRDHLVSVALILAPIETEDADNGIDDAESEAQRGNNSERDLEGVGEIYDMQCQSETCGCKTSFELTPAPPGCTVSPEIDDPETHSIIAQLWEHMLKRKLPCNGEDDETLQAFEASLTRDRASKESNEEAAGIASVTSSPPLPEREQDWPTQSAFPDPARCFLEPGPALEGSCDWLLNHEDFKNWRREPNGVLWIKGGPGTGKSIMLKQIALLLKDAKKHDLVMSCFFEPDIPELKFSYFDFYRSLHDQLHSKLPSSQAKLLNMHRQNAEAMNYGIGNSHRKAFESEMSRALNQLLYETNGWFIIDGLRGDGPFEEIEFVKKLCAMVISSQLGYTKPLHVCFSIRHAIGQHGAHDYWERTVQLEDGNSISFYVPHQLSGTRAFALSDLIVSRAQSSFSWALPVLRRVLALEHSGASLEEMKAMVQWRHDLHEPAQLWFLISRMYGSSLPWFLWICSAPRPLSVDEVRWAVALQSPNSLGSLQAVQSKGRLLNREEAKMHIQTRTMGLVETGYLDDLEIFQVINDWVEKIVSQHKEPPLDGDATWKYKSTRRMHHMLALICERYIGMEEFNDLSNSTSAQLRRSFPLLHYSVTSWVVHRKKSDMMALHREMVEIGNLWPSQTFMDRWVRLYSLLDPSSMDCPVTGTGPMHIYAKHGIRVPLTAVIENNPDAARWIDTKDSLGHTPLSYAAREGHEQLVRLLLEFGVDVNAKDVDSWTPLHWATSKGHVDIVRLLLEHGGDVKAEGGPSGNVLQIASTYGFDEIVRVLLDKGVDPHSESGPYGNALQAASAHCHVEVVEMLVNRGASITFSGKGYGKALLAASARGNRDIVKILLNKAAEAHPPESRIEMSLRDALAQRDEEMIDWLMSRGADEYI